MKHRRRGLGLLLMLVLLVALVPMPQAGAASVSGQDIVNCAKQYIGKVPYVWGGTKIDGSNPGADCSGFICRIYEKFGIDMWANRTKLRNCGTNLGTDLSVAQPGDIIWFDGHVAIYAGKDAKGNHTIVHETGGSYQNVVHTKVSVVGATLKGVIRIPGVSGGGSTVTTPSVTIARTTDATYKAKEKITNTNAVVVNQITKPAGVKVTQMGVYLYDASGSLIKKYTENVSNVGANTTSYHSWYDINAEAGVTLTPGTTYGYQFFGVFNGTEVKGTKYSFTTTGAAPSTTPPADTAKTYKATFYLNASHTQTAVKTVTPGQPYGTLPTAETRTDSTFDFWGTEDGDKITSSTIFNGSSDIALYPYYLLTPAIEEEETYTVVFMDVTNMTSYGTFTVKNGDKYTLPSKTPARTGYTFDGWYTSTSGGTKITASTTVSLTGDTTMYARWSKAAEPEPETNIITLQIGSPYLSINGKRQSIDDLGTKPIARNNRTLLPVRAVVEAMGGTVGWDAGSQIVPLARNGKSLYLQLGNMTAWDSQGKYYTLDVAPAAINNRTMLPIRFIVEYFDGTVGWDAGTQTVTIEYQ